MTKTDIAAAGVSTTLLWSSGSNTSMADVCVWRTSLHCRSAKGELNRRAKQAVCGFERYVESWL